MMPHPRIAIVFVLLALVCQASADPPRIERVVISNDGSTLSATYFRHAINRPGTDWAAWVVTWNLADNTRTILPSAAGPIALSSDGQWLAAMEYSRTHGRPGDRATPQQAMAPADLRPALFKVGATQPDRYFDAPDVKQFTAITFSGDGKELIGLADDGRLLGWTLAEDKPATEIARMGYPVARGSESRPGAADEQMLFAVQDKILLLTPGRPKLWDRNMSAPREVVEAPPIWLTEFSNRSRVWSGDDRQRPLWSLLGFRGLDNQPFLTMLAPQFVARMLSMPKDWHRIAFAPAQKLFAHIEPGARLATVRDNPGRVIAQLRFTPDGKQLVVSDRLGGLRFWDFSGDGGGRITRTLRAPVALPERHIRLLQANLPPDDKPGTFRVAAIQAASEFGKPDENRKHLAGLIRQAARLGAEVVVLPEAAVTGYLDYELKHTWQVGERELSEGLTGISPADVAETVPGPSTRYFTPLARELGIYLSITLVEVDRRTKKYYNTIVLLGPDGSTLIHYRKLNPWPWAERGWASDGDLGRPVVDTPFGRFGVLVCYDIHKQAEEMGKLKIDTLLYSIAWVEGPDSPWFSRQLPQRAGEYGYNIVAANWTLPGGAAKPRWFGYGQSRVIDSTGRIVAQTKGDIGPEIVIADLPLPGGQ